MTTAAAHGAAVFARREADAGRPVPASSPEPTRFIEGSFRTPQPPGPAGRGGPRRRPGLPGSPPAGTFVPASAAAPPFGPLTRPPRRPAAPARGAPRRRPGIPGSPPAGTFAPASAAAPPFGPLTRPAPDLPAKFVRPVRPRPSHPHAGRRPLIA